MVTRSTHGSARDLSRDSAGTDAYLTARREPTTLEMLFAHLKRVLRPYRLRHLGPCGARDELLLAATALNLRIKARMSQRQAVPAPA